MFAGIVNYEEAHKIIMQAIPNTEAYKPYRASEILEHAHSRPYQDKQLYVRLVEDDESKANALYFLQVV